MHLISIHSLFSMWLDSDAVFNFKNAHRRIEEYFITSNSHPVLVGSKDIPYPGSGWNALLNTGVFIIRNTEMGRTVVKSWFEIFDKTASLYWKKDAQKKWRPICGEWTDDKYEQGAFAEKVLPKHNKHVKIYDWYVKL